MSKYRVNQRSKLKDFCEYLLVKAEEQGELFQDKFATDRFIRAYINNARKDAWSGEFVYNTKKEYFDDVRMIEKYFNNSKDLYTIVCIHLICKRCNFKFLNMYEEWQNEIPNKEK